MSDLKLNLTHSRGPALTFLTCLQVLVICAGLTAFVAAGYAEPKSSELPLREELQHRIEDGATIQDLVAYAYMENPEIAGARAAWRAKVESYRVVTGLPDPQLKATYFSKPLHTRLGPQDWNLSLSQKIPFPGKLWKAGEIVKAEAIMAKLELDKTTRAVAANIQSSAHELIYIRAAKKIAGQNAALLEQLRGIAETAYANDRAALLDMMKALSQAGQLRYDALLLEELELTEMTRLNGLLNRPPDAGFGGLVQPPDSPLSYGLEELYQLASAYQEDIQIAGHGISRSEAQLDLARYQFYPDFNVGLFYASIGDVETPQPPPNAGRDALGVQVGLTLPIWVAKNQGHVKRAHADRAKARAQQQSRLNASRTDIHATYFRLGNARRLVELYQQELLPQAASALQTTEAWFQEGYAEFTDVIEAQSTWYNFQLSLARARADYGKHFARLEALVGHPLTRHGRPSTGARKERAEP